MSNLLLMNNLLNWRLPKDGLCGHYVPALDIKGRNLLPTASETFAIKAMWSLDGWWPYSGVKLPTITTGEVDPLDGMDAVRLQFASGGTHAMIYSCRPGGTVGVGSIYPIFSSLWIKNNGSTQVFLNNYGAKKTAENTPLDGEWHLYTVSWPKQINRDNRVIIQSTSAADAVDITVFQPLFLIGESAEYTDPVGPPLELVDRSEGSNPAVISGGLFTHNAHKVDGVDDTLTYTPGTQELWVISNDGKTARFSGALPAVDSGVVTYVHLGLLWDRPLSYAENRSARLYCKRAVAALGVVV